MIYSKESARVEIARLVEEFRLHEKALDRAPEAQIENDFIRPLFQCLNWNVRNTGLSPAQHEFRLQRTDRRGKRPDYILSLEGRDVLVMDAKQVKYSMRDPRWLYQVYSYAYSTQSNSPSKKIDFAVLTDFQEFIVLDCTLFAARPEAVDNFRVIDWRYPDYVEQFDTLWDLFERSLVLKNSGSQGGLWSRYLSPQKVKANRIAPDKAFLAQMDDERTGWRVLLAKDMKKRNPAATGDLITAAVQLLVDRLIFVKALSDREIDDDYLGKLAATVEKSGEDGDAGWFNACRHIFKDLNRFYNGSIFAPRPELEAVSVSNKVVRAVIRDLQPENSPYNFSVLPVEILGTIYERFLGRVVRTTDKQVKIEEKPEVRKAGGVFYTPQYIVENIVKNTVGKLLQACKTPADVAKLKILDPACGSGSFLLGAYSALIQWHKDYFVAQASGLRNGKSRQNYYLGETGEIRLTAKLKRDILRNNLFGVDIDPQAVEVTRFSLSLKALEDLREGELTEESDLFNETVLPDLSGNIKNGNSLIGMDYFCGQMFADAATMKRVNAFDWETEFPEIMSNGGFDVVIGNPPYIRIQTMKEWAPLEVEIYKKLYQSAGAGNYDIYVVFVEKALSLLNARGRLGFILPHKFFNSQYGAGLRRIIAKGKHLGHIVHFGDQQVFDGATTYTCLMFLDKSGNDEFEVVKVDDLGAWREVDQTLKVSETFRVFDSGTITAANVTEAEWNFTVGAGAGLFEKLSRMPVRLGDVAERIAQGIRTSANEIYVVDLVSEKGNAVKAFSKQLDKDFEFEKNILSLFLQGREIKRYQILPSGKMVVIPYRMENRRAVLISSKLMKNDFPLTFTYLTENKQFLENREKGKMRGSEWYAYVYPKNIDLMKLSKILIPDIADRVQFAFDENGEYSFTSGYGITLKNDSLLSLKYVLGLLNSRLLEFYIKRVSTPMQNGFFRFFTQFIEKLPICTINFSDPAEKEQHDRMVALVTNMLELHKARAAADTQSEQELYARQIAATDQQIDRLVYDLYGLTEEEINIVEAG